MDMSIEARLQDRSGFRYALRQQQPGTEDAVSALIALCLYAGSIVAANWMTSTFGLVPIGFGLAVTAGTFAAGAALVLRDAVDVRGGRLWVAGAISVGIVLSYLLADPFIALASAVAFAASELVDWGMFANLRPTSAKDTAGVVPTARWWNRSLARAVLVSSVVAAPVDTVLFLAIAGFDVTWQAVLGQFLVKTLMAAIAALWVMRR